jgi:hypothetical protein
VVTSRRHAARNWDCTTIGLPFGRCGIVVGEAIHVAREADAAALEAARLTVEAGLDAVHARAFALVGRDDPGGALMAANRESARLKASAEAVTSGAGTA